jgi:hypothetical protein
MELVRTPLLVETSVPANWPNTVGYPPPGLQRLGGYPAGTGPVPDRDAEYECSPAGKKIAKSHTWMFPSKRVRVCGKTLKT